MEKKKMGKFALPLVALALTLLASSCTNNVSDSVADSGTEVEEGATKEVSLNLNEEDVSTSTGSDPLTRADTDEGNSYYAVNVYKKTNGSYKKYAYGLFNSTSSMSLFVEEGQRYKFECVKIQDKTDTLYHDGDEFLRPFRVNGKKGKLTNSFTYSSTVNNNEMTRGMVNLSPNDSIKFARIYALYGMTDDFDPSESSTVSLTLMRSYFGLHFKITPPKDGNATLRFLEQWFIDIKNGDEPYDKGDIYIFPDMVQGSKANFSGHVRLFTTWTYSNGDVKKDTVLIPYTRNAMTTINMSFKGSTSSSVNIGEEDGEMGSENFDYIMGSN